MGLKNAQIALVGPARRCGPTAFRFWLREAVRNVGRPPQFQRFALPFLWNALAERSIVVAVAFGGGRFDDSTRLEQAEAASHRAG